MRWISETFSPLAGRATGGSCWGARAHDVIVLLPLPQLSIQRDHFQRAVRERHRLSHCQSVRCRALPNAPVFKRCAALRSFSALGTQHGPQNDGRKEQKQDERTQARLAIRRGDCFQVTNADAYSAIAGKYRNLSLSNREDQILDGWSFLTQERRRVCARARLPICSLRRAFPLAIRYRLLKQDSNEF